MRFETSRFGEIHVSSDQIFVFPEGLLGFANCTRYTFVSEEGTAPFKMMQSLDNPSLAFVVVDPLIVKTDYNFQVTQEDLVKIKAKDVDGLVVYAIVTLAGALKDATVNLLGPLIINPSTRLGHQFVLMDEAYTTREPLLRNREQLEVPMEERKDMQIKVG